MPTTSRAPPRSTSSRCGSWPATGRTSGRPSSGATSGVSTQAASEMFRRLVAGRPRRARPTGRGPRAHGGRPGRRRRHLPPPRPARVAADLGRRPRLGRDPTRRRRGSRAPSRRGSRPGSTRCSATRRPARTATRSTPRPPASGRRARRSARSRRGQRATIYRITEEAEEDAGLLSYLEARALTPGARVTVLARERIARLADARRPARPGDARPPARCAVHVLPGDADPALFHKVPAPLTRTEGRRAGEPRRALPYNRGHARPDPRPHRAEPHRARSTSGRRGPRCSTTCSPATPAARSCSGSRTPTSRGARQAFEHDILDGLHWLGIAWDEGPDVAGGERRRAVRAVPPDAAPAPHYAAAAARLLAADLAYPCYCTPEELDADRKAQEAAKQPPRYVGRCADLTAEERAAREAEGRRPATRFRVRPGVVGWDDLIRDRIEIDTANLGGDFVIVRADGTPLYHFTVVVDDAAMAISHVIRGEDHVSNTPKHILLFEALGHPVPVFGHLPLILNPDGTKMSKRKSQTAVDDYSPQGFIRRGWSTTSPSSAGARAPRRTSSRCRARRAVRHREGPEGRRALRSRPARMAERPVDPAARRRTTSSTACGRSSRRPLSTAGSTACRPTTRSGPCCRSSRSGCRPSPRSSTSSASCGPRTSGVDPAILVPKRWDAATTPRGLAAARERPRRATTP